MQNVTGFFPSGGANQKAKEKGEKATVGLRTFSPGLNMSHCFGHEPALEDGLSSL